MNTTHAPDDQNGGKLNAVKPPADTAAVPPPSPAPGRRRMTWVTLVGLIAETMGLLTAQTARWLNKQYEQKKPFRED